MKYKCPICGYIYDEEKEGKISELEKCPVCGLNASQFQPVEEKEETNKISDKTSEENTELISYPLEFERTTTSIRHMSTIQELSKTGTPIVAAMGTKMSMPSWDDILILGNQLNPLPLEEDVPINTKTIIGKNAKKPMILDNPIYVSHMSYGALSEESKIALAKGSAAAKTAMCSGEGGILPEEQAESYKYIFEYIPNEYSVTEENLKNADAIEIKIGQGTKPGMGGLLPGHKVTKDIAKIRNKNMGEDIISPATFPGIKTREDLKEKVDNLRELSDGRPIGIKIAAGHIEDDLEYISYAKPDFITIDGRGGATGASPLLVRDSTSVPTIYALHRARKYLDKHELDISLIITGGLRVSSDFTKALAMGADAVAIATASLIAIACQQYRACDKGQCPVGIATQEPELRKRLKIDIASKRLTNFLNASLDEIKTFSRITGHDNIHDLNINDLITTNSEISNYTNIKHV
ncbi:glutamate synthase-related protein [Methanosphaera sp. WGK6]|uniref:glutamate synthase-related protein n=1 Tax=Methanosphaera sp. WGK6 TaxID=1561964 RepID=UPI00084C65CD|nr:glutamate synthase-related protein [Methanosphaera sp. WGK6]OED29838.1 glutamate synthase [Methanosphaera sp. WGK6]